MNRRNFLRSVCIGASASFLSGCGGSLLTENNRKPNVLLIITDDQGYADVSAYAHSSPDVATPNIDRLAHQGVRFTQAYVTGPACSPSRAGLNTGRCQQRWGMWGWSKPLPKDEKTLAEYLKNAGYTTGKFGKSDFGQNYHRKDVREYPMNHGFDEFLGFSAHAHDYFHLSEKIEKAAPDPNGASASLGPLFHNNSKKSFEKGYTTEIFTDYAIDFIKRQREKPFFACVSYNSVHALVHLVPERYLERFGAKKVPLYDPEDGRYYTYYDRYGHGKADVDDETYRRWCLANMACMDDNIGRLLDTLEELNLEEDTFVVFMPDNGGAPARETGSVNRPLKSTKYSLFEGGIRIPIIMRYPGKAAKGKVCRNVVSTLDILPTFLAAAGHEKIQGKPLDGKNLLPMLKQPEKIRKRSPLFWHFGDQFAVRDGDWKLVKARLFTKDIISGRKQPLPEKPQLFNLKNDIGETNDLADKHPEIVQKMMKQHQNWVKEIRSS
ncbi:sulfatase-like hydrolase/transferase [Sedimentisphaera salicampi]|uniref:sulfatase-like hydrolase/transferase n=1 Tax=Sedimentisphaera salicampi TaxID=1941349 RepID=UPI000B9C3C59|nr:sulfatase-like hydrolase/transferase [Sedimentisphaera salicampi]OXU14759.1 Arylsulfatase precursor [Sedimentisphaera salicampi]